MSDWAGVTERRRDVVLALDVFPTRVGVHGSLVKMTKLFRSCAHTRTGRWRTLVPSWHK